MHRELLRGDVLAQADVLQQLTGLQGTLPVVHLPAHEAPTKQVHKQVKVEVNAAYLSRQIADIAAVDLIGLRGHQCTWLATLLRRVLQAARAQLAHFTQQPVQGGFTGHIQPLVQHRHKFRLTPLDSKSASAIALAQGRLHCQFLLQSLLFDS